MKMILLGVIGLLSITQGFSNDDRGAWIDIPTVDFALPCEYRETQVGSLVKAYHDLEKTSLDLLPKRIAALEQIHSSITETVEGSKSPANSRLTKLDTLVQKKIRYLKRIDDLYNNKTPYDLFLNFEASNDSEVPLVLVNEVFFDFKLPIYWGLFWLEALDPCHRFLTAHYLKWKDKYSEIPFFLWLEDQEIPHNAIQVDFLKEQEVTECLVDIKDGLFVHQLTGEKVNYDSQDQEYIFALMLDKRLIVAKGSEHIRHSSLTLGKPVLGAGALKIHNGNLIYIDAESGHYQPTPKALHQVLEILKKQGAIINYQELQVKYYLEGQVFYEQGNTFVEKYSQSRINPLDMSAFERLKEFKF